MTCPLCSSPHIIVTETILHGGRIRTCYCCDDCCKEWDEVTHTQLLAEPLSVSAERKQFRTPPLGLGKMRRVIETLLILGIVLVHVFVSPHLPVAIALVGAVLICGRLNTRRYHSNF